MINWIQRERAYDLLVPLAVWFCLAGLLFFAFCIWHDHTTLWHTIRSLYGDLDYLIQIAWGKI